MTDDPTDTLPAAPPPPTRAAAKAKPRDPARFIGVDNGSGGYEYLEAPKGQDWEKDRRLSIGGANHEHVDDDADGCWLYRRM